MRRKKLPLLVAAVATAALVVVVAISVSRQEEKTREPAAQATRQKSTIEVPPLLRSDSTDDSAKSVAPSRRTGSVYDSPALNNLPGVTPASRNRQSVTRKLLAEYSESELELLAGLQRAEVEVEPDSLQQIIHARRTGSSSDELRGMADTLFAENIKARLLVRAWLTTTSQVAPTGGQTSSTVDRKPVVKVLKRTSRPIPTQTP